MKVLRVGLSVLLLIFALFICIKISCPAEESSLIEQEQSAVSAEEKEQMEIPSSIKYTASCQSQEYDYTEIKSISIPFIVEVSEEEIFPEVSEEYSEISIQEIHLMDYEESSEETSVEEVSAEEPSAEEVHYNEVQSPVYNKYGKKVGYIVVHIYNQNKITLNPTDSSYYLNDVAEAFHTIGCTDIPLPAVLLQAYTEGGAGRDVVDSKQTVYSMSNNMFGIMATSSWSGKVCAKIIKYSGDTMESTYKVFATYADAVAYTTKYQNLRGYDYKVKYYRVYDTMKDSLQDYINLIHNSYTKATNCQRKYQRDWVRDYLTILVKNGYAGETEQTAVANWLALYDKYPKLFRLN